jgi:hypothetical protein
MRRVPLAKRLLKEAEELTARGVYVKPPKNWDAAQIVKAAEKGKELKSRGGPSAKQLAKTEEAWSRADVPAKTSTGWTPPGDVKYAVEDAEQFAERFKN